MMGVVVPPIHPGAGFSDVELTLHVDFLMVALLHAVRVHERVISAMAQLASLDHSPWLATVLPLPQF